MPTDIHRYFTDKKRLVFVRRNPINKVSLLIDKTIMTTPIKSKLNKYRVFLKLEQKLNNTDCFIWTLDILTFLDLIIEILYLKSNFKKTHLNRMKMSC